MKEYELCIDVPIQPGDAERFKVILQRLKTRVPVQLGGVYDQEKGRNVKLYGGERKVLIWPVVLQTAGELLLTVLPQTV